MGIVDGKVAYEHIYWDQASLLAQVGLLDPAKLPVVGCEQADKLRDPTLRPSPRPETETEMDPRGTNPPGEMPSRAITRPKAAAPCAASAPAGRPRSPPHP